MTSDLRARLAAVPDVHLALDAATLILVDDTAAWLSSDDAVSAVATDPYWPKWDGPWWQMLTLSELGLADRIPARIVDAMVKALDALPVHTFPIREHEWPPGVDRRRHSACPCALGCIDQVLAACGVDVDRALPWVAPWFTRYQLADGGYTCDDAAYLITDECPSSMVATIAMFEAMLRRGPSAPCDRAAAMLIGRELRHGSTTAHNAEERTAAPAWLAPCFPRFYFYDVLRGATALARWAVTHDRALPLAAIGPVVDHLLTIAGDGVVRLGRRASAGKQTWRADDGWTARHPAASPPLLEALDPLGAPSPTLTRHWTALRTDLRTLLAAGRLA